MGCGTRLCSQRCIRALPVTLPDYSVVEKPASICPVTGLLVGWELLSVSHSTQYARKPKTARASDTTIVIRDFHSAPHPTAPSTASIYPAHTNLPQSRGFVERHPRRYRTHTTLASPFGPPILSPSHQISRQDSVTADFNQPYTIVPRDARVNSSGRSIERKKNAILRFATKCYQKKRNYNSAAANNVALTILLHLRYSTRPPRQNLGGQKRSTSPAGLLAPRLHTRKLGHHQNARAANQTSPLSGCAPAAANYSVAGQKIFPTAVAESRSQSPFKKTKQIVMSSWRWQAAKWTVQMGILHPTNKCSRKKKPQFGIRENRRRRDTAPAPTSGTRFGPLDGSTTGYRVPRAQPDSRPETPAEKIGSP